MKIALLLPDGVGIRNFVLSRFVREVASAHDLSILHVVPDELLPTYQQGLDATVQWQPLIPYTETPASQFARHTLAYAHVAWADTKAMRFSQRMTVDRSGWRVRWLHRAARGAAALLASPAGIRFAARAHGAVVARSAAVAHYRRVLAQLRPDIVFCTHQRPPIMIPAVAAARELGVPTATFIFSWDNLVGKGRIPAPFDHFLVWSAHMRDELRRFYPDVGADRVHIVGTPQFDFYADPELVWPRERFFAHINADPSRPLICYSGGDAGNSPEDPDHLRILLEHIRAGRIRRDAQVLLRPAPVDSGERFEHVRRAFPELISCQPEWMWTGRHKWDQVLPLPADAAFLTNLTRHADLNVNLASTMTLDFAIHDKPVVNVAFDVSESPRFPPSLWEHHYGFEHYQAVIALGAARFARSAEQFAEQINAYLADPSTDREGRRRLVELQLGRRPGESTAAIIAALERIATPPQPPRAVAGAPAIAAVPPSP